MERSGEFYKKFMTAPDLAVQLNKVSKDALDTYLKLIPKGAPYDSVFYCSHLAEKFPKRQLKELTDSKLLVADGEAVYVNPKIVVDMCVKKYPGKSDGFTPLHAFGLMTEEYPRLWKEVTKVARYPSLVCETPHVPR